jgi:hypothetical protein
VGRGQDAGRRGHGGERVVAGVRPGQGPVRAQPRGRLKKGQHGQQPEHRHHPGSLDGGDLDRHGGDRQDGGEGDVQEAAPSAGVDHRPRDGNVGVVDGCRPRSSARSRYQDC